MSRILDAAACSDAQRREDLARNDAAMAFRERVMELVEYDPATGLFRRRVRQHKFPAGSITGGKANYGYRRVAIDYREYLAHRLAWLIVHGAWPTGEIDHINGIRDDNRIENLRDVSIHLNRQNVRKANIENKTGYQGASPYRGGYRASIWIYGKTKHLGTFKTPEDAHAAYVVAKRKFHPGATI